MLPNGPQPSKLQRASIGIPIGELPFEHTPEKPGRFQYERVTSENMFCVWDFKYKRRCEIKVIDKNNMQSSLCGFREFLLGQKLPPSHFVRYIENHTFTQDISLGVLQKLEKFNRNLDFSSGKLRSLHHRALPTPFLLIASLDGYVDLETLKKQSPTLPDRDVKEILAQTLQAISLLGKLDPPLIHRGIRMKNIMWNAQHCRIKIAGCENLIEATEPHIDRLRGADWTQFADWLPQEACCMLTHLGPATSVDIYSVANLVMDLINVKRDKTKERFNQMDPKIIMQQVQSKQLRPIGLNSDLMLAMLASDSTRRPTPDHVLEKLSYKDTTLEDRIIPALHEIAGRQRKKESLEKIPALARVLVDRIEMHDKFIETILNMSRHEGVSVYRLVCILDFMFKSCGPSPELAGTIAKFAPLASILVTKARGYLDPANVRKVNDMSNYWENRGWTTHNTDQLHAHPIQPIQPPGHVRRAPPGASSRQARTPTAPGQSARTPTAAASEVRRVPRTPAASGSHTSRGSAPDTHTARPRRGSDDRDAARTPRGPDKQRIPIDSTRRSSARALPSHGHERSRSPIDYTSATARTSGTDQIARSPRTRSVRKQGADRDRLSTQRTESSREDRRDRSARTLRDSKETKSAPRTRTPTRRERSRSPSRPSGDVANPRLATPRRLSREKSTTLAARAAPALTQRVRPARNEDASSIASPCSFPSEDGWHDEPPQAVSSVAAPLASSVATSSHKKAPPPPPPLQHFRAVKAPPPPPPPQQQQPMSEPLQPLQRQIEKPAVPPVVKAKHARKAGPLRPPSTQPTRTRDDDSPSSSATSTLPPREREHTPVHCAEEHISPFDLHRDPSRQAKFGAAKAPPAPPPRTSGSGGGGYRQPHSAAVGSDHWPAERHSSPRGAARPPWDSGRGYDEGRAEAPARMTRGRAPHEDGKHTYGDFRRNGTSHTYNNKHSRSRTPPHSYRHEYSRDHGARGRR